MKVKQELVEKPSFPCDNYCGTKFNERIGLVRLVTDVEMVWWLLSKKMLQKM
jgi:hypothetical protein